ncbi:MAG: hypothetical protein MZW92_41135 [Comamonadaceae bacterium]|nr:hypothetical protein [Comamonadaceae bacterium]
MIDIAWLLNPAWVPSIAGADAGAGWGAAVGRARSWGGADAGGVCGGAGCGLFGDFFGALARAV